MEPQTLLNNKNRKMKLTTMTNSQLEQLLYTDFCNVIRAYLTVDRVSNRLNAYTNDQIDKFITENHNRIKYSVDRMIIEYTNKGKRSTLSYVYVNEICNYINYLFESKDFVVEKLEMNIRRFIYSFFKQNKDAWKDEKIDKFIDENKENIKNVIEEMYLEFVSRDEYVLQNPDDCILMEYLSAILEDYMDN